MTHKVFSHKDALNVGIPSQPPTQQQIHKVQNLVCANATDAEEASFIMDMLGVHP